jgi:hypothetical protein
MSFWTKTTANPKRKFRFKILISGSPHWLGGSEIWYAKTCTAPSVEVTSVEHMFSDHVFNFPGRAKWADVSMMLVDPAGGKGATSADPDPNTVENFSRLLEHFGYNIPSDGSSTQSFSTVARNKQSVDVAIQALDDNGDIIETWNLKNAFPISFKYGDFDYAADDLREMEVVWKYDWAQLESSDGATTFFKG